MSNIFALFFAVAAFFIGNNHGQQTVEYRCLEDDRCFVIYDPLREPSYYIVWFDELDDKKI
jgi:hypothetical protein